MPASLRSLSRRNYFLNKRSVSEKPEPVRNSNSPASLRSLLRGDYFSEKKKNISSRFSEPISS